MTPAQRQAVDAGVGIYAKNPQGTWTLQEHLIKGSSKASYAHNPGIATTPELNVANEFSSGNGIIKIDLNKLNFEYNIGHEIYLRNSAAYHFSVWQQEVSIFQYVLQEAITLLK